MKNSCIVLILFILSCCNQKAEVTSPDVEMKIRQLTKNRVDAEVHDNLDSLLDYYDVRAISMPEFQLTLEGRDEIKLYYAEILFREIGTHNL